RRGSATVDHADERVGDADSPARAEGDPAEGDAGVVSAAVLARQAATGLFAATALGVTLAGLLAVFGGVVAGGADGSYLRRAVVAAPAAGFIAMLYVLAASVWWGRRLWQLVRVLLLPPVAPADG